MKWYYKNLGAHTHVRVFMGGALSGQLCFSRAEFRERFEPIAHGSSLYPKKTFPRSRSKPAGKTSPKGSGKIHT